MNKKVFIFFYVISFGLLFSMGGSAKGNFIYSLLISIPLSPILAMIFFLIYEKFLTPLYKWFDTTLI
jgi:lipoprotein signal peptidase